MYKYMYKRFQNRLINNGSNADVYQYDMSRVMNNCNLSCRLQRNTCPLEALTY